MKKILLLLSSLFLLNVTAQNSIQLINVVGTATSVIAPNSVIQSTVGAYKNRKVDIDIKNTSTSTNTYTATRYDVLLNSDPATSSKAEAYYCFAGSCFGTVTIVSPPLVLRGGKRATDTTLVDPTAEYFMLTADLDEAGKMGKSIVKYTFKNIAVAADSVQVTLTYNGSLGYYTIEKELSGFDVYPNPANDVIEVKFTSNKSAVSKAVIINALGSVVKEKEVAILDGKNTVNFDIADLPSGIYFARVTNGNQMSTRKFVVN